MFEAPAWKFRRMHPGEMNIDPIEAEFFSTEALGSLADAFVREAIQNSLDARLPGAQLRIRILFPPPAALLEAARQERYLAGLLDHLHAPGSGVARPPAPGEPLEFIVVEDFGTRGLQGDPRQSEDEEIGAPGPRNDFYYFWRNIGRSRKQASELGRWGLGKTVFPAASRINAFFALTVRAEDRRRLLMGQAVLKIHKLGGRRIYPYGYFGGFEDEFAVPVEDAATLDRFCADFGLARGGEAGLSAVIPCPDPELKPETIIPSIVRHYFVPVIAGDLVVEVERDGRRDVIDAATLPTLLETFSLGDAPRFRKLVELAKWGLALRREDHAQAAPPPQANAPRWIDDCIGPNELARLKERFDNGWRIALSVPVWVKPAAEAPVLSRFDVYLERDEALDAADDHFVRDGITVAGVRAGLQKGVRAFVCVREPALSRLLGDSENPAHTEWQERSPKFKDRYHHGPYTLRYVKNAPREIVRVLTRPAAGRDLKLLQHLFALEVPTEAAVADPRKKHEDEAGTDGSAGAGAVETVGGNRFFQLHKLRGGFRIAGTGNGAAVPGRAAVSVAYEVRRGNPFKQYQPPDFELGRPPIAIETYGAEVAGAESNTLALRITRPDFRVTVKGFDPHRDIRVRVEGGAGEGGA